MEHLHLTLIFSHLNASYAHLHDYMRYKDCLQNPCYIIPLDFESQQYPHLSKEFDPMS